MPKTKSLGLFLFGLVTGTVAMVVVQPADVIKTELQMERRRVTQLEKDPEGVWGFIVGLVLRVMSCLWSPGQFMNGLMTKC